MAVHTPSLGLSLLLLPIIPSSGWKPAGDADPTLRILGLLSATIGLPYLLLSTTGPLLQAWYLQTHKGVVPYRLFALSNFGSMLALLSFPFAVEPYLTTRHQAIVWSVVMAPSPSVARMRAGEAGTAFSVTKKRSPV